jgi:hypothetical protein
MYIHYKRVSCLKRRSIHVKKKLFMYISIKKNLVLCNNLIYKKEPGEGYSRNALCPTVHLKYA